MNPQGNFKRRLVYLYPQRYAFVSKDIEGLTPTWDVLEHRFIHGPAWLLPFHLIRQFAFLLNARRKGARQVLAHFAGYHTVLPVLLGFQTHIIIAGSDACSFPTINYGSFRKPIMGSAMAFSLRRAVTVLPVHGSLEHFTNTYSDFGPSDQGYHGFIRDLRTPSTPIPYGFDAAMWSPVRGSRLSDTLLCVAVGAALGNNVHFRKGVDLIIDAARQRPLFRFTVVGLSEPATYRDLPSNVKLLGAVDRPTLQALYAAHSIYLQPSVMEGFPNALCEAMLCGCIPVVSNVTSMPHITGGMGAIIHRRNLKEFINAIDQVILATVANEQLCRERVRERVLEYTLHRRIHSLNTVLESGRTQA